jgi:hypothetical protein
MAKITKSGTAARFYCPGCRQFHAFIITDQHVYNGNDNRPTITPVLVFANAGNIVCSATIKDGRVTFGMDSRHKWAGQTTDLPDITGGIPQ